MRNARVGLITVTVVTACAHRPPTAPVIARRAAFTIDSFGAAAEPGGCARRVVFELTDVATGVRAPASLCLATIPDAPDGTWFWIAGPVEAELADGKLVVDLRIRANDFDPEGTGRAMRVALWDGGLDGVRSTGAYRGRAGRLHGGGKLFFEPKRVRAEVVLVLDLH